MSELAAELRRTLGPCVEADAQIGERTTYRVGGRALALVTIDDTRQLDLLFTALDPATTPVLALGRGSNLLIADAGFDGVVVTLGSAFSEVHIDGAHVFAGAAAKLPVVARSSVQAGLTGFEWAVGVPGSIGGAVRMNAGGHGSEMADVLIDVEIADLAHGQRRMLSVDDLALGYRQSSLGRSDLVLGAHLQLKPGDPSAGKAAMAEIVQWRREHQPGGQNAGSVFTNPTGDSAGRLIEAAGAKGLRIGSAQVSTKHANFIQADEDGCAADVLAVMKAVQDRVAQEFGVRLHPETHLVGFEPDQVQSLL